MAEQHCFSGPVTSFHGRVLPETATPAGYAALIDAYDLVVPLPRVLAAISKHHHLRTERDWRILTPRHSPSPDLEGHLTFALRYEGLDLAVLKRLFAAVGPDRVAALVRKTPTGSYARRIWFLFEWLTGARLDLPDARSGSYAPVVDPRQQWAAKGELSYRHRVRNNLSGTPAFCPMVFRTELLELFAGMDLAAQAQRAVTAVPKDLLARTAAFLLLKDSRSSYAIEGQKAPQDRIQRWGRAIGEAGRHAINLPELLRLLSTVIGDNRFVRIALRQEGGFVGEHERDSGAPLPDHISARAEDLESLIDGLVAFDSKAAREIDAVIVAAMVAFGFVYIHPFQDGNGRIHRYLIHHVLAQRGFNPAGVVFPVSSAILEKIDEYRAVLEDYSKRLLPAIEWQPTPDGNVAVLNDTGDFYRYFDATPHAEFLYSCVRKTIDEDLPREAEFLGRYDRFLTRVERLVDMPHRVLDILFRFLRQNGGRLSKRAREQEFKALSDEEVTAIEAAYNATFDSAL